MIPIALESSVAGARSEAALSPAVVAAVAARAAAAVPGVRRVEPGVTGLVTSVVRAARQRVKGLTPAPTEGVRVFVADGRPHVEIGIAVSGQAIAVGNAVRAAVAAELAEATGISAAVTVAVLDIELPR
ncbi:hypothetical protein [Actinophytocola glycyrrhizae]|uniref:Asp23/Gls24 family envelope stress response protein n=1 Tax=Actinophytocola glycyrrhizae TaxID=2044873 RepID=A0ABV9S7L1_9PSEU